MNLVKQFRKFGELNEEDPVPGDAQVLYYNMLHKFNLAMWPAYLDIKTMDLEHSCNMTRKRVSAARDVLVEKGYIKYYPAKRASGSPIYVLVFLYETHNENITDYVFPTETHNETHNSKKGGSCVSYGNTCVSQGNTQGAETQDSEGIQPPYKQDKLHNTNKPLKHTEPKGSVGTKKKSRKSASQEDKNPLYVACVAKYDLFIRRLTDHGAKIDGAQGTAMKRIIAYLKTQVRGKTDEQLTADQLSALVLEAWTIILDRHDQWRTFNKDRIKLTDINSELVNILKYIKDASTKTNTTTTRTTGAAGHARSNGASIDDLDALKQ